MSADTRHSLFLSSHDRVAVLNHAVSVVEDYIHDVDSLPVESIPDQEELRAAMAPFDFAHPLEPFEAINRVAAAMRSMQTHTAHRRYFGLFNPGPTIMGIAADTLVAGFNPQLAAWSHAPFAAEVERHLIAAIGSKFGPAFRYGAFTSGGAEANLTALLCALVHRFPTLARGGVRSLERQPLAYASAASHHSLVKALRILGLGSDALRIVPCDDTLGMDPSALSQMVRADEDAGHEPFAVAITAGATATGVVERIRELGAISRERGLWTHVDAAWGGYAAFVPELSDILAGISEADSITFDPHKMLSVPMGAGMLLTQHRDILGRAFSVTADYMPASNDHDRLDPFTHSLQWSRRFIGLKILLSLAVAGWNGYAEVLRCQTELGRMLRAKLREAGWDVVNQTPLPVVCFAPVSGSESPSEIVNRVVQSGVAWISLAALPTGAPVIRACITNYRTSEGDIDQLLHALGRG
jgi:glutamate/tyrosine decarboxylase-like PLP-dependent enzyme